MSTEREAPLAIVGSTSAIKVDCVKEALSYLGFPSVEVLGFKAASNINEQPFGHEETISGAVNRLEHSKQLADQQISDVSQTRPLIAVAIENGIFAVTVGGKVRYFDLAWVVVEDLRTQVQVLAHSTGIEFPSHVVDEVKSSDGGKGFVHTTVGSALSKADPSVSSTDPHNSLTNGKLNRKQMLVQCVTAAISQLDMNASKES